MSTATATTREGAANRAATYPVTDHTSPRPRPVPTRAFGAMTDAELAFLARYSRNPRTVVAAECVLIGRRTAVPARPPAPTMGGPR